MFEDLNSKQKEAISIVDKPVLVIAGAGSGKTSVITQRIIYLIKNFNIFPRNILAVTFTNKAANEMKKRIINDTVLNKELFSTSLYNQIWIGTFHSVCARILRKHINILGYKSIFNIYNKNESINLIKECIKLLSFDIKQYNSRIVHSIIENAKNRLLDENEFSANSIGFYNYQIGEIYKKYQEQLIIQQALDYGDLILKTVVIFKNFPTILEYYQKKFKQILVDEYQDINHAQYIFIKLLSQKNKNLFVVGDPDQSIYGFRGAELSNIINFEKDFTECKVVKLEQNYRSTEMIIRGATQVIKNNIYRKEKKLWTEKKGGEKIKYYEASSINDEANFVAQEIINIKRNKKINWADFAVLYRINTQSRPFEEVFAQKNIPFKVVGNSRFYEKKEIKYLINILSIINNSYNKDSIKKWLEIEKIGIGKKGFQSIVEKAEGEGEQKSILSTLSHYINLSDNRITLENKKKIKQHINIFMELQKNNNINISKLVEKLIKEINFYNLINNKEDSSIKKNIINNVKIFIQSIREFEKLNPEAKLDNFLNYISLVTDMDIIDDLDNDNKVNLMTLHCVKGLEFQVVFLTGFEEGLFPHRKSITNQLDLEEERRLCYVGMTRAMDQLYITFSWRRNVEGMTLFNQVSRFFSEIPKGCIEKINKHYPDYLGQQDFSRMKEIINIYDLIFHPDWGEGIITNIQETKNDSYLTVNFNNSGIKRLSLKYAPIKKIKEKSQI
ncbi:MAG: UvrD-helicase domain-containing protein [Atribacterota bacterium]|nr:UvrD-helicase domain-containing protein [Atribacterota bacterium]MDD4895980.1 UvrD-helicase domain-containing protein [Atribacterota bacterium]